MKISRLLLEKSVQNIGFPAVFLSSSSSSTVALCSTRMSFEHLSKESLITEIHRLNQLLSSSKTPSQSSSFYQQNHSHSKELVAYQSEGFVNQQHHSCDLNQQQQEDKDGMITSRKDEDQHPESSRETKKLKNNKKSKIQTLPKKKKEKEMDFSKYPARHVAFKVAYLGWNYHGLTEAEQLETIENCLFRALEKAKMIPDRKLCLWARSGRTDKGVSSFGQIVSLLIRTKLPMDHPLTLSWPLPASTQTLSGEAVSENEQEGYTSGSFMRDEIGNLVDRKVLANEANSRPQTPVEDDPKFEEYPYLSILNHLLPPDIRVVAWSPVRPSFHARFSCIYRHYNYFFYGGNLNIPKMQEAASKLVGTHDFRNFCKIDLDKEEASFQRSIFETEILPMTNFKNYFIFSIKGQAFLWHQVRCIMAILFLVGQEKETADIVDRLLDLTQHPEDAGRPIYAFAEPSPLVLRECGYHEGTFNWKTKDPKKDDANIINSFYPQWHDISIRTAMTQFFLDESCKLVNVPFNEAHSKVKVIGAPITHVPLLERERCDSLKQRQTKSKKYKNKMKRKLGESL